ncbi:MAG: glycosyltransferase [Schleiferiaceae bacterium]|nr:glycosyltransferase [Schleiferiaceae bacterium]
MRDKYNVSVVIATYNRQALLKKCLSALACQTISAKDFEVIVVNDGGTTLQINDFQLPITIQIINLSKNGGPGRARNKGAFAAQGRVLAFTDDDCQPDQNWLKTILNESKKGYILGGAVQNALINNLCAEASQQLINFLYTYNEGSSNAFFTSNNLALYATDFRALGGFDETFTSAAGEDREFGVRANRSGLTHRFCDKILVNHFHKQSFIQFYRLHKKYGKAALTFRKINAKHTNTTASLPQARFYFKMILFPFKHKNIHRCGKPYIIALLLVVSQIAVGMGYVSEKIINFNK